MNPALDEVAVKSRLAYVPDAVAFFPWMNVREALDYFASFRRSWNFETELKLLESLGLDPGQKTNTLSKGQKTQLALIAAICAEPELLVLDEPTSGLDPIVRREFIETVIGAYQDADPGRRTVFVSTHLISEFEGLIDTFTIIDAGKEVLTLDADVEHVAPVAGAAARLAGDEDVREEDHLDLHVPRALAFLAPAAGQVEREGRCAVLPLPRQRLSRDPWCSSWTTSRCCISSPAGCSTARVSTCSTPRTGSRPSSC
jgi:ABC-type uncharacterized transport system ATPase subunit